MATRELVSVTPTGRAYTVEFTVNGQPRQTVRRSGALLRFNHVRVVARTPLERLVGYKRPRAEAMDNSDPDRAGLLVEIEELEWLLSQLPAAVEV